MYYYFIGFVVYSQLWYHLLGMDHTFITETEIRDGLLLWGEQQYLEGTGGKRWNPSALGCWIFLHLYTYVPIGLESLIMEWFGLEGALRIN